MSSNTPASATPRLDGAPPPQGGSQPARRLAASLITLLGAALIQLAGFVVMTRASSPEIFGRFIALTSTAVLLAELMALGGGDRLVRAVARDGPAAYGRALGHLLQAMLATWPVLLLIHGLVQTLWISPGTALWVIALAAAVELPANRALATAEQAAIAHGEPGRANRMRLTVAAIRFAVLGLAAAAGWLGAVEALVAVNAAGGLAAILVIAPWLLRAYGRPQGGLQRADLAPGLAMALLQFSRGAQQNLDRVLLAVLMGPAALAVYAAALRAVQAGGVVLQAYLRLVYPGYFQRGSPPQRHGLHVAPRALALAGALSLALWLVAPAAPTVFGAPFAAATPLIRAAAWVWPLLALGYVTGDVLTGADRPGLRTAVAVGGIAVQVLLLLVLAPRFGPMGAVGALYGGAIFVAAAGLAAAASVRRAETEPPCAS